MGKPAVRNGTAGFVFPIRVKISLRNCQLLKFQGRLADFFPPLRYTDLKKRGSHGPWNHHQPPARGAAYVPGRFGGGWLGLAALRLLKVQLYSLIYQNPTSGTSLGVRLALCAGGILLPVLFAVLLTATVCAVRSLWSKAKSCRNRPADSSAGRSVLSGFTCSEPRRWPWRQSCRRPWPG